MSMDDFSERLQALYTKQFLTHGRSRPQSVSWSSMEHQSVRFQVLLQIADLSGQSVLDVGSGLGDLFPLLIERKARYTGIELTSMLAKESEQKYPGIQVIHGDFLTYHFTETFDYVLCSGAFNARHPNHEAHLVEAIRKMFHLANKGVAFNLPSSLYASSASEEPFDKELGIEVAYVDPTNIFLFSLSLTPRVILRHDYLPHDFTMYLYK